MAVLEIVGSIIAAGSTIAGGLMSAESQEEANATNLFLNQQQRQDTLSQNEKVLKANERAQSFAEKEARLTRAENNEDRRYVRLQNAANRYTQILNEQKALEQGGLSPIISRGR